MLKRIIRKLIKYAELDGRVNQFTNVSEQSNIGKGYLLVGFKDGQISIGKYCDIAENFRVRPRNHSMRYANIQRSLSRKHGFKDIAEYKGNVEVGNACWIGDNVQVLSGVKIGNGVAIGAGSVVTKDIPDFAVIAGVPAKILKFRFSPEIIEWLNVLAWWNWDEDKISRNKEFFETDLDAITDIKSVQRLIK